MRQQQYYCKLLIQMNGSTTPKTRKYSTASYQKTTIGSSAADSQITIKVRNPRKGSADLNLFGNNYKTQVCKYWLDRETCPFAETCVFAHGGNQIRSKDGPCPKYKTKLCQNFHQRGFCPYGQRCQFIHNDCQTKCTKVKRSQLFDWFGVQLVTSIYRKKYPINQADNAHTRPNIINSQTPLIFKKLNEFESKQSFQNESVGLEMGDHSKLKYLQICDVPAFTKPRLYSL